MTDTFDILIKNAIIIDGTGRDAFTGDIGIRKDKIAAIGDLAAAIADKQIDAAGKTVTPGFIDPHSHGDMSLLFWPTAESYVMQGVTTIIGGNCGMSSAPSSDIYSFSGFEYELIQKVHPGYFSPGGIVAKFDEAKEFFQKKYGVTIEQSTFGQFLDRAEQTGVSLNLVPVIGHSTVRLQVMGLDSNRPARTEEIEQMKGYIRDAMECGSFGMSTGLDYPPGGFAETEEIIALAKVAAEFGGIYETHFRSFGLYTGRKEKFSVLDGIREALEIGKKAGIRVQLSHMSPGFQVSPPGSVSMARAMAEATIAEIEKGPENGVEVAFDVIPNTSGGGCMVPHLADHLRPWILQAGSIEQFVKNLNVPDFVAYLKKSIERGDYPSLDPKRLPDWMPELGDCFKILTCKNRSYEGRMLSDIARELKTDSIGALIQVVKEDPFTQKQTIMAANDEVVKSFLNHPRAVPSSDGFCFDQTVEMDLPAPLNKLPHPNNFCYAIRYLTTYPKTRFEDNIRQMTGFPAEWFGIKNRGTLETGKFADIVIFDKTALKTNEDHAEPRRFPDGIDVVIINGKVTCENKSHLGTRAGMVLRRK